MIYRTLRENELEAWVQHCLTVFTGPTDTPDYFRDHYLWDPYRDPEGVMIAEDNGQIVATVRVFAREAYIDGFRVTVGGIGEVSTIDAYRRKGISGKLLEMAIDYMVRKGMDMSLLFTGVHGHYARYGWFTVPRRLITPSLEAVAPLPENAVLRPLTANDLPTARGLYGLTAGRFVGAFVREHPDYWSDWMMGFWKNPLALVQDQRMVAYLDIELNAEKNELILRDYATELETDWLLPMLAAYVRGLNPAPRVLMPSALMPKNNGPFVEWNGGMVRLNAPFNLGDKRIDTAGKLAAALADSLFWEPDAF